MEYLQNLLETWWSSTLAAGSEVSSDGGPLRKAEVLMASLPPRDVAWCVVELMNRVDPGQLGGGRSLPQASTEELRSQALLAAWLRATAKAAVSPPAPPAGEHPTDAAEQAEEAPVSRRRPGRAEQTGGETVNSPPAADAALGPAGQSERACGPGEVDSQVPADDEELLDKIEDLYRQLPVDSVQRCQVLAWLAWDDGPGLERWVELVIDDPPLFPDGLRIFFEPLLRREDVVADRLYPRLLQAVSRLDLATAVLDLANYFFRHRDVRPHPAQSRLRPLSQLLADVTQQLLQLESAPLQSGIPREKISQVINESVGLLSALCDCLALIGDASVAGKLYPCLEIRHRRVQLEAAYALASLGQEDGKNRLIQLAAEPLVRRRVLSYAESLGCLSDIDPQYQTPAAVAESQLVLSLAHPQNLGLAPKSTKLLDQRTQHWPGYEQPIECFLFQFEYPFSEHTYRNVGIVGPATHSFSANLSELSVEDQYAVFAGWQVEHPEIYIVSRHDFGPQQAGTLARLQRRMQDQQLEGVQPELLGYCLGGWVLVARGLKAGQSGWAIADAQDCYWLPDAGGFAAFDAALAWYFWLGRTLLRQFNPA